MKPTRYLVVAVVVLLAMIGCAAEPEPPISIPEIGGGQAPPAAPEAATGTRRPQAAPAAGGLTRLEPMHRLDTVQDPRGVAQRFSEEPSLSLAVDEMPVDAFIHHVFGELLELDYVLSEEVVDAEVAVSLSVTSRISPRRAFFLAREILAERGFAAVERDGVFFVLPESRRTEAGTVIGIGRNRGDVPDVLGEILQIMPVRYGMGSGFDGAVREFVDARVTFNVSQSVLYVQGEREEILRAVDVISILDQPGFRGRHIGMIELVFLSPDEFVDKVIKLLENEGITAKRAASGLESVTLVPLSQLGAVAVFAGSGEQLDRVDFWARQIDQPRKGSDQQYFVYEPRFSRAADLGASVAALLGRTTSVSREDAPRDTRSSSTDNQINYFEQSGNGGSRTGSAGSLPREQAVSASVEGLSMAVDPRSNTLLFFTSGARYQTILPLVRRLDVAPKQVLIEATIAEVTLTDEFALGVEFALANGDLQVSTEGNLGLPSGGVFARLFGGQDRIAAQLSANDQLVNILSNPTLVVRDGVTATIGVGDDIPTIGATFFDPTTSERQVTAVQYRKTGVNLAVRPTINAQGLVVLQISQNISSTVDGGSGVQGAPSFFERALETEVIARSGETVLLGGLISEDRNRSQSRVPGLGRLPGVGRLFRSDRNASVRTELVILITPRVIEDGTEWDRVRDRLGDTLQQMRFREEGSP